MAVGEGANHEQSSGCAKERPPKPLSHSCSCVPVGSRCLLLNALSLSAVLEALSNVICVIVSLDGDTRDV